MNFIDPSGFVHGNFGLTTNVEMDDGTGGGNRGGRGGCAYSSTGGGGGSSLSDYLSAYAWGFMQGAESGAYGILNAFAGGLFDPSAGAFYQPNNPDFNFGHGAGEVAITSLGLAGSLSGISSSGVLNSNRYVRIGPGRWGKDMVPRISFGNGRPSWWNHWRL